MKDLFKKLHEEKKLPEDLEKEIMKSYDTLKLIADITDLFTEKMGKSEAIFHVELDELMNQKQKEKEDDENEEDNNKEK